MVLVDLKLFTWDLASDFLAIQNTIAAHPASLEGYLRNSLTDGSIVQVVQEKMASDIPTIKSRRRLTMIPKRCLSCSRIQMNLFEKSSHYTLRSSSYVIHCTYELYANCRRFCSSSLRNERHCIWEQFPGGSFD